MAAVGGLARWIETWQMNHIDQLPHARAFAARSPLGLFF